MTRTAHGDVRREGSRSGTTRTRAETQYCTQTNGFVGNSSAYSNVAYTYISAVLTGDHNQACNEGAIGSGQFNVLNMTGNSGGAGFIAGGSSNVQFGNGYDFTGTGTSNENDGLSSFIGAGTNGNIATATVTSAIVAGNANSITATSTFIGAGSSNVASVSNSAIVAGSSNKVSTGSEAFVGAGDTNSNESTGGAIVAGSTNDSSGDYSFVGSGLQNGAVANEASVVGGDHNVANMPEAFVGGGQNNTAEAQGAFLGAGTDNNNQSPNGFIGAGVDNSISTGYSYAFIGAGNVNTSAAPNSMIGAGSYNAIGTAGSFSSIVGGYKNTVSGEYASVLGGYQNTASASYAVVLGGDADTAGGTLSLAAGYHADAAHNGSFVWSDYSSGSSTIKDATTNQFVVRASGGTTFYSNEAATSGVSLAAGSGTWASLSDRNAKTDIVPLDDASILTKVGALPLSAWRYKSESGVRHVGPMAQDFYAAFGVGEDNRHITSIDEDGVALAAIQALHRENHTLRSRMTALERRLDRLDHLAARLHD